jgi:hypothetical protein
MGARLTARSLLKKASELGVTLVAVDGRIKGRGARPDPAFLAELLAHEPEIVALLRQEICTARTVATVATVATVLEATAPALAGIPEHYRQALARFKVQQPISVTRFRHNQAVNAAEMFITRWGRLADKFGWTAGDIFDWPRDGIHGAGLAWWLGAEIVRSLGPEHAVTEQDRVFDRMTRAGWVNP